MRRPINEQAWHQITEEITSGIREWRFQHPKATRREMEQELDTRWLRARTRMLQAMTLAATAASWADTPSAHHPECPECTTPLHERGTHPPTLQTHGGQDVTFDRTYGVCPACGAGLFPRDDELGLVPGTRTPRLQEALVRLSTHIRSFAKARAERTWFTGATVHPDTGRRQTIAAGDLLLAHHAAEANQILPTLHLPVHQTRCCSGSMEPSSRLSTLRGRKSAHVPSVLFSHRNPRRQDRVCKRPMCRIARGAATAQRLRTWPWLNCIDAG